MSLDQGTRLGPYEVLSPLGAGGMGEVYKAVDTRLGRPVAIKVLPPGFASDTDRLKRFEREARSASALNHPSIVTIYDIGSSDSISYIAMELVEGKTLRETLGAGALPVKRTLEIAMQVVSGLAAAHDAGIVHRDLKPENIMLRTDGLAKVLDFGLAKLTRPESDVDVTSAATASAGTAEGVVMGTVGYMSPEQASGQHTDFRSDQFALGAILYEMATGRRAFHKRTAPETLAAIIREEPESIASINARVPAPLRWVAERCLAKEPAGRYAATADLARELRTLLEHLSEVTGASEIAAEVSAPAARPRRWIGPAIAMLLLLGATHAGVYWWGKRALLPSVPSFKRLTFRRGTVDSARFSRDGQSVLYSARWDGKPMELSSQRVASPDARPLGVGPASVAAVSSSEVAVILQGGTADRTLARLPLEGGAPRAVLEMVGGADWSRDGSSFAVIRNVDGRWRLEYPTGKVLFELTGMESMADLRLSPRGDWLAFIRYPARAANESGEVVVIDRVGMRRVLSAGWLDIGGLAWSADGGELWFTATKQGTARALHAVTLGGKERLVLRVPESLLLHDVAPDGRALVSSGSHRFEMRGRMAGDTAERDLSWLDGTWGPTLAPDGTRMVFQEMGEGGGMGQAGATFFRRMDGSPAVRLADLTPHDVSPDWKWVLCHPFLVPIGAGEQRTLAMGKIETRLWAYWHPDGQRILVVGNEKGRPMRVFVQEVPDGLPRPLTPEGVGVFGPFSRDGRFFIGKELTEHSLPGLYPVEGGEPRPIPGVTADEQPQQWSEDDRSLFVTVLGSIPLRVQKLDMKTGKKQPWLDLAPRDLAGVSEIGLFPFSSMTPGGRYYAYHYLRTLSDLYVIDGLR